jgi:hypothetical protein
MHADAPVSICQQCPSILFAIRPPPPLCLEEVFPPDPTAITHALENAAPVVQIDWPVKLRNRARVHDADAVVPDNGFQTVRDAQQRLAAEPLDNRLLDLLVRLEVDRRRRRTR